MNITTVLQECIISYLRHNSFLLFSHGEDVLEKLATLDRESLNATLPTDIESIKRLSCRLEDIRRSALESHRLALQDGQALIEQLTVLKNRGSLDSRPDHILPSVKLGTRCIFKT